MAYGSQNGYYTRIGNKVYVTVQLTFTPTFTTASGAMRLTAMPFTSSASITSALTVRNSTAGMTYDTGFTQLASYAEASTTYLRISQLGSTLTSLKLTMTSLVSGVSNNFTLSGYYTI
jgi:hypothetical protein